LKKFLLGVATAALLGSGLAAAPTHAQEPIVGEMRILPYSYCPRGWAEASGTLLAIATNTSLYSLYGTTYGGDGVTSFALPDMRGRMAMGVGAGPGMPVRTLGMQLGTERETLTVNTMPSHNHLLRATSSAPNVRSLDNASWGDFGSTFPAYNSGGALTDVARSDAMSLAGGGQAHQNIQPALALRHCVALVGIYPSRN
jgi:microcystin-dependent protein